VVEKQSGAIQSDRKAVWVSDGSSEERDSSGTTTRRMFESAEQVSGAGRFFTKDHQSSVTDLTDAAGSTVARYGYDPTGRRSLTSGSDISITGYTSHRWQVNGGLWLTQFRAYDPNLGRWLSEDPARLADGVNMYRYVDNNFVNYFDPNGLTKVCCRPVKGLSSKCHCWIILDNSQTLGAYRFGTYLKRIMNHSDDRPTPPGSTCSDIPNTPCDNWREWDIVEEYLRQPETSLYGPTNTSNTAVSRALHVVPYNLPSCAMGRKY